MENAKLMFPLSCGEPFDSFSPWFPILTLLRASRGYNIRIHDIYAWLFFCFLCFVFFPDFFDCFVFRREPFVMRVILSRQPPPSLSAETDARMYTELCTVVGNTRHGRRTGLHTLDAS